MLFLQLDNETKKQIVQLHKDAEERKLPINSQIEYEWRLHQKTGQEAKSFYDACLYRLNQSGTKQETTVTKVYQKGNFRKISSIDPSSQKEIFTYQKKHKLRDRPVEVEFVTDISAYDKDSKEKHGHYMEIKKGLTKMRYDVSIEENIQKQEYDSSKEIEKLNRTRTRHSFHFPTFHIDVSHVIYAHQSYATAKQEEEWHVEIEFATNVFSADAFSYLFPSLSTLFTKSAYDALSKLTPNRGIAPVNIMTEHIDTGLQNHYVTNKLDGVAYSIFSCKQGLVVKNDSDCIWLTSQSIPIPSYIQFRCEFFKRTSTEYEIHLYDMTSIYAFNKEKEFERQFSTFTMRKQFMEDVLPMIKESYTKSYLHSKTSITFTFFVKTFISCNNFAQSIQQISAFMLTNTSDFSMIAEQNDGLVFQPDMPSQLNPPLKWKFFDKISVDFKCGKRIDMTDNTFLYPCYVFNMDTKSNESFTYNKKQVFLRVKARKSKKTAEGMKYGEMMSIEGIKTSELEGRIVETNYQTTTDANILMNAMRIRFDKIRPNASKVAQDTMFDMLNERTLPMLIQQVENARAYLRCDFRHLSSSSMESQSERKQKLNTYAKEHNQITQCFFPDYGAKTTQRYHIPLLLSDQQLKPTDAKTIIGQVFQSFSKEKCSLTIALIGQMEPSSTMLLFAKEISREYQVRRCASQDSCTLIATQSLTYPTYAENQEVKAIFHHNIQLYNHFYPHVNLLPYSSDKACAEIQNPLLLKRFGMLTDTYIEPIKAICLDFMQSSIDAKSYLQQYSISFPECKLILCIVAKDQRGKSILDKCREMDRVSKIVELESCYVCTMVRSDKVRDANNNLKRELILTNTNGKRVLDIGSGKGGDLAKYRESKATHITMVEPNYKNYVECKERISKHYQLKETKSEHDAALFASHDNQFHISTYHARAQDILRMHLPYQTYDVISMQLIATFFFDTKENLQALAHAVNTRLDPVNGVCIGTSVIGTYLQSILEKQGGEIETDDLVIKVINPSTSAFGYKINFDLKESATATSQEEYLVDWQSFVNAFAAVGLYLQKLTKPSFSPTDSFSSKLLLASTVGFVFTRQPPKEMLPMQVQDHFLYRISTMCQYNALGAIYNSQFADELKELCLPYFTGLSSFLDTGVKGLCKSTSDKEFTQLVEGLRTLCTIERFYSEPFGLQYVKAFYQQIEKQGATFSSQLTHALHTSSTDLLQVPLQLTEETYKQECIELISTAYTDLLTRFASFGWEDGIAIFVAILSAIASCLQMQFALISNSDTITYIGEESDPLSVLTLFQGQLCVTVAIPQTNTCRVHLDPSSMVFHISTNNAEDVKNELSRRIIYLRMKEKMINYILHSLQSPLFQYAEAEQLFTYLMLLHLIDAKDSTETWFASDSANKDFLVRSMHTYLSYGKYTFGWFASPLVDTFLVQNALAKESAQGLTHDTNTRLAGKIRMNTIALKGIGLAADYEGMGYESQDPAILEAFASSVNRYFDNYCSAFPDVDTDSKGNFFTLSMDAFQSYKLLCVNPPYELTFISRTITRCYEICKANPNLTCMLVLPDWTDSIDLQELKRRSFKVISFKKGEKDFKDFDQGGKTLEPCNTVFCFIGKERKVNQKGYIMLEEELSHPSIPLTLETIIETDRSALLAGSMFSKEESDVWLQTIIALPLEVNPKGKAFGGEITMHRSIGFFSDTSRGYKFSNKLFQSIPFTTFPQGKVIMEAINEKFGTQYNGILVNVYHDENDYISQHADDEKELDASGKVIALSFGASRTFRITKHPRAGEFQVKVDPSFVNTRLKGLTVDFPTQHGQMLIMDGDFQKEFYHGIPEPAKSEKGKGIRASLTFRYHKR